MSTKNLMSLTVLPINHFTTQDLPIDFVELSEIDLQHIVGGRGPKETTTTITLTTTTTTNPDGSTTTTITGSSTTTTK